MIKVGMKKRRKNIVVKILFVLIFISLPAEPRRGKAILEVSSELQAVCLTTWALASNPQLFSSYLIANMISPVLWMLKDKMPARSPEGILHSLNRRLRELSSYIRTHVSYPYFKPTRPERDQWGWVSVDEIKTYIDSERLERCLEFLNEIMNEDPKYYEQLANAQDLKEGKVPYWRNETVDVMWAYRSIRKDGRAVGKCYGYAELIAAALHIICEIPLEKIYLLGNLEHLVVFVDEGEGYYFSLYAYKDRTNLKRSFKLRRFEDRKWWAYFFDNISFIINGPNYYDKEAGTSTIPKEQLQHIFERVNYFGEGFFEIPLPDFDAIMYLPSTEIVEFNECRNQEEAFGLVKMLASAGSPIYMSALYAYRYLYVPHPQTYVKAALRDPWTREKAQSIKSLNDAINIVRRIKGDESIFHSSERIALPDEVFLFNTASHRERALVLYTLIKNSLNKNEENLGYIVYTPNRSYVFYENLFIDVDTGQILDSLSSKVELMFNEEQAYFKDEEIKQRLNLLRDEDI